MTVEVLECCGLPMMYIEVFGIRIYSCDHRSHHPVIYVNLYTGQKISDEELPVHWQDVPDKDW